MTSAITRLKLLGDKADELTKWQADVELREAAHKRERDRKDREAREQQRQAANISQEWWTAIDQRIHQYIVQSFFFRGGRGMAEGSHWPSTGYNPSRDPQGIQNRNRHAARRTQRRNEQTPRRD